MVYHRAHEHSWKKPIVYWSAHSHSVSFGVNCWQSIASILTSLIKAGRITLHTLLCLIYKKTVINRSGRTEKLCIVWKLKLWQSVTLTVSNLVIYAQSTSTVISGRNTRWQMKREIGGVLRTKIALLNAELWGTPKSRLFGGRGELDLYTAYSNHRVK